MGNSSSSHCKPRGGKVATNKRRLNSADKGVESLKLGRYPFRGGIKHYLDKRYGFIAESTLREEEKKLKYLGKVLQSLKDGGRIANTDPRNIREKEVQELLAWMRRNGLDPTTQASYVKYLKGYLRFFKNRILEDMKAEGYRFPSWPKKPIRTIDEDDLVRIFETVDRMEGWHGTVSRGIVSLAFSTGMRPKELRLAELRDLNLERERIYVRHPKGEGSWGCPCWTSIIRPDMVPMMRRYLKEREAHVKAKGLESATFLFPNLYRGQDEHYSLNAFNHIKGKIEKESLVDFRIKDFRATICSLTIRGDHSRLPAMSAQLRHTDIRTTQQYYADIKGSDAGRQLRDAWKETPVIRHETPAIDSEIDYTGYA